MSGTLRAILAAAAVLWRRPGYALAVVATLALGLGAATAVYALLHGVLLQPLPFPDAERVRLVRQHNASGDWNTSVVDFQAIAEEGRSFSAVASMRPGSALVGSGERAQWLASRHVTADFFRLLGLDAARGRTFAPGDDREGAPRTVVISQALAERQFGAADPLGQTLAIDGVAHSVIGVMPAGVEHWPVLRGELWPVLSFPTPQRRGPFFLATLVRIKPEVSLAQADEDLAGISRRLFPKWQSGFQDDAATLVSYDLHRVVVGNSASFLWLAFAAVAVVLGIALVNCAHLMGMRLTQRGADLGVRAALGASRSRLLRLLLGEQLVLVGLGALAGLGLAWVLLAQYRALGPALPRLAEVALDPRVLGFGVALAAGGALLLALPTLLRRDLANGAARAAERGSRGSRAQQRLRDALVVLEFALALPLLLAAALLAASLWKLQRVDPGFDPAGLLSAGARLPAAQYAEPPAQIAFWQRARSALAALPGVRGVALLGALPPQCGCWNDFQLIGRPTPEQPPQASWVAIDGGGFAALGVPLLEGRSFDSRDTPDSDPVLVVTRAWAERHFPGESALGKTLHEGGDTSRVLTIVGVVGDVRYDGLQAPGETVFGPVEQGWGRGELQLLLRTDGDPLALAAPLQRTLRALEATLVAQDVQTLEAALHDALGGPRHWAAVIAGFAVAAVVLAAIGVFGVLAYQVAQRERELGIRQALGADGGHIVALVLRRGLLCAALGIALGSVLAALLGRGLQALLFDIERSDPLTWLGACAGLLAIAALACWLPARRAVGTDPLRALRQE
jgi:putative ABC transport system permease protein